MLPVDAFTWVAGAKHTPKPNPGLLEYGHWRVDLDVRHAHDGLPDHGPRPRGRS